MGINVFTFSGRIGRDATVRHTGQGKAVVGFPVAVDVGWGENKRTLWIDCTGWGERFEKLADYLPKGSVVTVTGEADLQTYSTQDGERTKLVCNVQNVQLPPLDKSKPRQERQEPPHRSQSQRSAPTVNEGFDDDDIPF